MLATCCTVIVLAGIIYEDFKFRRVRISYFIVLLPLLFFQNHLSVEEHWRDIGFNLIYLGLLLSGVAAFGFYKGGTIQTAAQYLGLGDFLFLLALAFWLNPVLMIIFNSATFLLALIVHAFLSRFSFYAKFNSIPLAGIQGICFLPVFLYIGHLDTSWTYEFYN